MRGEEEGKDWIDEDWCGLRRAGPCQGTNGALTTALCFAIKLDRQARIGTIEGQSLN